MSFFIHRVPEFDIKINKFPLLLSVTKEHKWAVFFCISLLSLNVFFYQYNFSQYMELDYAFLSQKELDHKQSEIIANILFMGFVLGLFTLLSVLYLFSEVNYKAKEKAEKEKVLFLGKTNSSQVMDYILSNKSLTAVFFLGHGQEQTVFQSLIHSGVNLNYQNSEGDTALHLITRYDMSIHIVIEMLLMGADPTIANNQGHMPSNDLDKANHPLWINYQKLKFSQNIAAEPRKNSRL